MPAPECAAVSVSWVWHEIVPSASNYLHLLMACSECACFPHLNRLEATRAVGLSLGPVSKVNCIGGHVKLTGLCLSIGWCDDDPVIPPIWLYLEANAATKSTVGRGSHSSWGPHGSQLSNLRVAECWSASDRKGGSTQGEDQSPHSFPSTLEQSAR